MIAAALLAEVARAAAAHGGQVRRGRLHRAVRAGADLRRDHGDPPQPHRGRARRAAEHGRAGAPALIRREPTDEASAYPIERRRPHERAARARASRTRRRRWRCASGSRSASARPPSSRARRPPRAEVREAVVISTCNRTEVYLVVGDPVRAEADVLGLLARRAEIRPTELAEAIYSPRNCDAARQLYRVTAGLESMILGEAEIQGQVRRAHEAAMRAGCTGPLSNRLFAAALTHRQARALGDGDRLQPRERALGGRRSRAEPARRPRGPSRGDPRRGRDERADRARAGRRRAPERSSSPTATPTARSASPSASAARSSAWTNCPTSSCTPTSCVCSTASPHPIVGREELELVMHRARAPRAAADRHRRAPRRRPRVRRARGRQPVRHRRPAGGGRAQPQHARRGDAARARDRGGGDPPLRALARPARLAADGRARCAPTATTSSTQVLAENSGRWESASRATSRASRRSRARS